jgi:hypothetical protein
VARKSSFTRFGGEFLAPHGADDESSQSHGPAEHGPESAGAAPKSRIPLLILLVICIGLAVGLMLTMRGAAGVRALHQLNSDITMLRIEGMIELEKNDFAAARESLDNAMKKAREYQAESPGSYIESVIAELKGLLENPVVTKGATALASQKRRELRELVEEMEPADIALQLGSKGAAVADERIRRMSAAEIEKLIPDLVDRIITRKLADLPEEEVIRRLGGKLDAVCQKWLESLSVESLRIWLGKRVVELVKGEIARRAYNSAELNEVLGGRRLDVVRSYLAEADIKELGELIEPRFGEIERYVAGQVVERQARVTLDNGTVLEGQILHDGPVILRLLREDGVIKNIPKSRISKVEKTLRQDKEEKQPEQPEEPQKGPGESDAPPGK